MFDREGRFGAELAPRRARTFVRGPRGFNPPAPAPGRQAHGPCRRIASGGKGTAEGKFAALEKAGVITVRSHAGLGAAIAKRLKAA
jgi:succinyl-CoA synthetase alpha subunit